VFSTKPFFWHIFREIKLLITVKIKVMKSTNTKNSKMEDKKTSSQGSNSSATKKSSGTKNSSNSKNSAQAAKGK
jgi:hypothetical protein